MVVVVVVVVRAMDISPNENDRLFVGDIHR
jgi:hypothetical protein